MWDSRWRVRESEKERASRERAGRRRRPRFFSDLLSLDSFRLALFSSFILLSLRRPSRRRLLSDSLRSMAAQQHAVSTRLLLFPPRTHCFVLSLSNQPPLLGTFEGNNVYTICMGPAFDQLRAFVAIVEANPHLYSPANIETALRNAVPAIDYLFTSTAAWPLNHNPPPPPEIFSFGHLADAIQDGATMEQNQQGTKPLYARILECMKHDFPENVHPLEPGPDHLDGTRMFCVIEKVYVEIKILQNHSVTDLVSSSTSSHELSGLSGLHRFVGCLFAVSFLCHARTSPTTRSQPIDATE